MPPCVSPALSGKSSAGVQSSSKPQSPHQLRQTVTAVTAKRIQTNILKGIVILSDPSGATVTIDENIHQKTPIRGLDLQLGNHQIFVQMPGYQPISQEISLIANFQTVRLVLKKNESSSILAQSVQVKTGSSDGELNTLHDAKPKLPYSRKILAGWLGMSSAIAFGTSIALTVRWLVPSLHLAAPDFSCGEMTCQYDLRPHFGLGYSVAGLTAIGLVMSLTLPIRSQNN